MSIQDLFEKKIRETFPILDDEMSHKDINKSIELAAEIHRFCQQLDAEMTEDARDRLLDIAAHLHSVMGSNADIIEVLVEAKRRAATRDIIVLKHCDIVKCLLNHVFQNGRFSDGPAWEKALPIYVERYVNELRDLVMGLAWSWASSMWTEQFHDDAPYCTWYEEYNIKYDPDEPECHTFLPTESHVDIKKGMTRDDAARQVAHIIANLGDVDCPYVNVTLACDYDSDADTLKLTTTCAAKPGCDFVPIPQCQASCPRRCSVSTETPQSSAS